MTTQMASHTLAVNCIVCGKELLGFQRLFAKGYLLKSGDCFQPGSAARTGNAMRRRRLAGSTGSLPARVEVSTAEKSDNRNRHASSIGGLGTGGGLALSR